MSVFQPATEGALLRGEPAAATRPGPLCAGGGGPGAEGRVPQVAMAMACELKHNNRLILWSLPVIHHFGQGTGLYYIVCGQGNDVFDWRVEGV